MKLFSHLHIRFKLLGLLLVSPFLFALLYYSVVTISETLFEKDPNIAYQRIVSQSNPKSLPGFFTQLAKKKGALYAFNILNTVQLPVGASSHFIAHDLGYELYKQYGIKSVALCPSSFGYGCIHTVSIELLLENKGNIEKMARQCDKNFPQAISRNSCYHGLGHGTLAYTYYDFGRSIALCGNLKQSISDDAYTQCFSGTVMEMVSGIHDQKQWAQQFNKYFRKDDLLAPCNTSIVPPELKRTCYTYFTPYLLTSNKLIYTQPPKAFQQLLTLCMNIPEETPRDRDGCFGGFGRSFLTFATNGGNFESLNQLSSKNLEDLYQWCRLSQNEDGKKSCIKYEVFTLFLYDKLTAKVPVRLCNAISDSSDRQYCFSQSILAISMYKPDSAFRQNFCSLIHKSRNDSCSKLFSS